MASLSRGIVPGNGDVVLGVGLAAVGVVESLASHLHHATVVVIVGLLLGGAVALARWSLWIPVAATAVLLPVLPISGVSLNGTFVPLFAVVLTAYLAAARGHGRQRGAMLAALLVAVGIAVFDDTRPIPSNLIFAALMVIAPALAGGAVATRQRFVGVLQERTRLLEQQRASEAAAAVAAERLRIARELHDIVAHSLSVMALQAGGVRRHLVEDQRAERDMLLGVERIARTALEDMHRMLHLLRADDAGGDTDLIPQPGLSGLDELLRDARTSGLDVVLRCSGDVRDVPAAVGLTAYRIVQESLTNVRKHSDARRADVCIDSDGRRIRICISDDGTALPGRAAGAGLGLLGMRERVAVHGGELTAAAKEDGPGFLVQATLPVHADADAS